MSPNSRSKPPPTLDSFQDYVEAMQNAPTRRSQIPPANAPVGRIQVRRFAGPEAFAEKISHIRIAHLTDIHVGRVTPMKVQFAAAQLTNEAKPDLVVITGDFVCHGHKFLDELYETIKRIHSPVLAVLGNHDHWAGAGEVRDTLRRAGALVLDNVNTVVTIRGDKLQIVGLDDAYTGHADRDRALKGLRTDLPTLGLSHIAEEADRLWPKGVQLVLSGHTHAGQITVARLHELAIGKIAGHKYVHGLYGTRTRGAEPGGAVYVGAGIGAAVMPLRFGERGQREIALFDLGAVPGTIVEHHREQKPLQGRKPTARAIARRKILP